MFPISNQCDLVMYRFLVNKRFLARMQAKTKVNMWNMYREKRGLTRESLVSPGLLVVSNIETERGYLGKRRACNNLWKKKRKSQIMIKNKTKQKKTNEPSKLVLSRKITKNVSDIRFMCNINYTWVLKLPHTDGSVEDPEIKSQTLCLLAFN